MPEEQFKRHVAYKLRIHDILIGKPVIDNERFSFLELGNRKIVRVNIIGNIVDKYDSEGEKKYTFITLDDGSEQIKIKSFGDDSQIIKNFVQGQTILVIGTLRSFNNEIYIAPEIVREFPIEYLLIRKLEIEKNRNSNISSNPMEKEKVRQVKDDILERIKLAESNGGIEVDEIILKITHISPDIINQEIKKMLEEGIIFEPRPGKLRYLG